MFVKFVDYFRHSVGVFISDADAKEIKARLDNGEKLFLRVKKKP